MHTFIFDIGKTNLKAAVIDTQGDTVWQNATANISLQDGDYLTIDSNAQWQWLQHQLHTAFIDVGFQCINISTHGACAALVDECGELTLPIMDYESPLPEHTDSCYAALRPSFADTCSPKLGLGLNLGAQLHWLKSNYPDAFARTATLLMLPQYFAYLLTGIACHEVTSLGCHTDLWDVSKGTYSCLVDKLSLRSACPPIHPATKPLGTLKSSLAEELGIDSAVDVYPGLHDSNAGLARYLFSDLPPPFTVISSGTWVVSMAVSHSIDALDERRDMLANVDIHGTPTACARFMGGREYQRIIDAMPTLSNDMEQSIATMFQQGIHIVPGVEANSGPCSAGSGKVIVRNRDGIHVSTQGLPGDALATIYLAQMIDLELSLLHTKGPIIFGSIAQKNPWLVRLVAQLRPQQQVLASAGDASTVTGAWCVTRWDETCPVSLNRFNTIIPSEFEGLTSLTPCDAT